MLLLGGEIVAQGTPQEAARVKPSFTGQYLRPILARHAQRVVHIRDGLIVGSDDPGEAACESA